MRKSEAFADDKLHFAKMMNCIFDSAEKGENAGHHHFLLVQQCFQKP